MSGYYDQDELTRPGHTPRLSGGPGCARGSCSCGWWREPDDGSMSRTIDMIRAHIDSVDNPPPYWVS